MAQDESGGCGCYGGAARTKIHRWPPKADYGPVRQFDSVGYSLRHLPRDTSSIRLRLLKIASQYHRAREPHSYRARLMLPGGRDVQSCRAQAATVWTISQRGDDAPPSPDPFTPNASTASS